MMLQKYSTSDIILLYRLLNPKHTTDKAEIRSTQWGTNEHIFYVRAIHHHKVESVTGNVSGTANQQLTTEQIRKIKSIAPGPIIRKDRLQAVRVMSIRITNKDSDCLIIN